MKIIQILWLTLALMPLVIQPHYGIAGNRGMEVQVKTKSGNMIDLYHESYALIIGNGNYTNGWDKLSGAIKDVEEVAKALEKNGFRVTLKTDITRDEFDGLFSTFVREYGKDEDNRLIFYYAGHGYTEEMATEEQLGSLVMVDAPLPAEDTKGFDKASVDMVSLVTEAKKIRARHVLYMFDSCFSGSVLNLREQVTPESITDQIKYPVRQFITAGRADEPVPDHSTFKQAFLDLLTGLDKEPIPDGYITGEELGLYLKNKVPEYNPSQHPQYGKINDPKLNKGDFVFLAGGKIQWEKETSGEKEGKINISSNPSAARLYVDGTYEGDTPQEIRLSPGVHEIRVEKTGYKTQRESVQVRAGKDINVKILLEGIGGTIVVKSEPSPAKVYLDGRLIGETPDTITDLKPLRYTVEVRKEGYQNWSKTVELGSGEEVTIMAGLVKIQGEAQTVSKSSTGKSIMEETATPKAGDIWKEPVTGMEFVFVKAGEYEMGCGDWAGDCEDDEKPAHRVKVDDFYMGKYEVTNAQFSQFIDETDYKTTGEVEGKGSGISKEGASDWGYKKRIEWKHPLWPSDDIGRKMGHPVVQVSWDDAKAFVDWLSGKTGKKYRLPTEAEWEYAARGGGAKVKYAWGDGEPFINGRKAANIADESVKREYPGWEIWGGYDDGYVYTSPVGSFAPNRVGLYDMGGNVWEWCSDWYGWNYYKNSIYDNPQGPGSGAPRVVRGGSWNGVPRYVRAGNRFYYLPEGRLSDIGFRLSRTP